MSDLLIRTSDSLPDEIDHFHPLHMSSIMWPGVVQSFKCAHESEGHRVSFVRVTADDAELLICLVHISHWGMQVCRSLTYPLSEPIAPLYRGRRTRAEKLVGTLIEYLMDQERWISIDNLALSLVHLESINSKYMNGFFRYTPICCISVVPAGAKPTENFSKSLKQTIRTSRRSLGAEGFKYDNLGVVKLGEIYSSKVTRGKGRDRNRRILEFAFRDLERRGLVWTRSLSNARGVVACHLGLRLGKNYYYMFPWFNRSVRGSSPGSLLMHMMVDEIQAKAESCAIYIGNKDYFYKGQFNPVLLDSWSIKKFW